MKHTKMLVMLCFLFALVLATVACGGNASVSSERTTETTAPLTQPIAQTTAVTTAVVTTTVAEETTAPKAFTSLKIGETSLSDYRIVYAKSEYSGYLKISSMKEYFPVYDFDHETADRLSDLIYDLSGVRLKVVQDQGNPETANEILIGKTNRTESVKALKLDKLVSDDFLVDVEGTKLVICGGEHGTTWHALDYLEKFLTGLLAEYTADYTFASDFTYKGSYHLIRITCIGDSITAGAGSNNAAMLSYPAQMGRYLWKDALVRNLGSSGATMRDDLAAYTARDVYTKALQVAAETDLFTIMLGTNDSFYDTVWTSEDSKKFNDDCLDIVKSLFNKNNDLQFVLSNCPRYFGNGGWASKTVRDLQAALVPVLNNAGYPTTFFDMYTPTSTMRNDFPDELHPSNAGYLKLGKIFADGLQPVLDSIKESYAD